VGADLDVPRVDGRRRRYVNLDYAASTPALAEVWAAIEAFVPWYRHVPEHDEYEPTRRRAARAAA
jgi:hypothetical protein